ALGRAGVRRVTEVEFGTPPGCVEERDDGVLATFRVRLGAYQTKLFGITVMPIVEPEQPSPMEFDVAVHELRRSYEEWERESTQIVTDNEVFDQLLDRSLRDLRALSTITPDGGTLAAGIPWYVTLFGRDSLIAAHQLLMVNP